MRAQTRNGWVEGTAEQGMQAFRNIPFARPPVGSRRFLPPAEPANWPGTRDCTGYGPRPCQVPPPWCLDRDTAAYGEDCLNLNVWTPAADAGRRPVIFSIFGGGHMEGSNSELGREGWRLAHGRDVVVVAANYRVGALGYLYLGHLLGPDYAASGSLGLLDQIAALRWVRDNIAFFGGDPARVTVVGQSAGGKSVCSLLAAPAARGLIHRAVAMSGALQSITDVETDKALTRNFLSAAGLHERDAARLLDCPAEEILAAQEKANATYFKAESYGPTADGVVLPVDIEAHVRAGGAPGIPILMGHTCQELFPPPDAAQADFVGEAVAKKLRWKFGDNAPHVMARYRAALASGSPAQAWGEAVTEYTYAQAYLRTAELFITGGLTVWLYRWDYAGSLTAGHSSDNEALYGCTDERKRAWDPEASDRLDRAFQQTVLGFAEGRAPRADGLPPWAPCAPGRWQRMIFDAQCRVEPMAAAAYDPDFPLQVMKLNYEKEM